MNLGIEIVAYFCECMMQLLCIHAFLGKKIKCDIKIVITVVAYIFIVTTIMCIGKINALAMIVHIVLFIYIKIECKLNAMDSFILVFANIFVSGFIQLIVGISIGPLMEGLCDRYIIGLIINFISLIAMIIIKHMARLEVLYNKAIKWDKTIIQSLFIVFILFAYLYIRYKIEQEMEVISYLTSAILAFVVIAIAFNWQKDRYQMKQKSLELYMHELYGKTFEGMIENIRIRQHDFKNQLAAIYGMHLTSENFEELVESQKKYCDYLISEGRYDSILTKCNDKILAGFLYTKFTEWEKKGISFKFDIVYYDTKCRLATYELIEVSGILIDNASEYVLSNNVDKTVEFILKDSENAVEIVCRNQAEYIPIETINKFFKKGYSTKGSDRGLGLYNVKKILESKGEIQISNRVINEVNHIEFRIVINR